MQEQQSFAYDPNTLTITLDPSMCVYDEETKTLTIPSASYNQDTKTINI